MARERRRIALATVCAGYFMVILDTTALTPALPVLRDHLGADISTLQWVVDGYALTFAAVLLSGGALGDRLGARGVFRAGAVSFAVTSGLCALAPDATTLVLARIAQGVTAALLVPTSLALLQASFPEPAARARAVGAWGAVAGVAAAGGPVVGGVLAQTVSWRAVFLLNVPIGLASAVASGRYLLAPEARHGRSFDVPGQVFAIVGLGAMTFALIEAGRVGWTSPVVPASAVVAVAALTAFVVTERRSHAPVLALELFRSPSLTAGTLVGLLINLGFYGQLFVVNLLLQDVRGLDPLQAGLALLPEGVLVSLGSALSGRLTARAGTPRRTMLLGLVLGAAGMAGLAAAGSGASYAVLVVPLMAAGVGMSLTMPAATTAVVENASGAHVGVAAGVLNAARQVGGLIGVALLGTLIADDVASGAAPAFALAAGAFAAAAGLTAARVDRHHRRTRVASACAEGSRS